MPKPYTPNDKWSQRAAKEGFRARSVYKLMELDRRFHILQPGMKVLDLGAAPGSWLQYAAEKIGPAGKIVGVDLQAISEVAPHVAVYRFDITDGTKVEAMLADEGMERVDAVLSDIAPSTSGVQDVDQWRSVELAQAVIGIAAAHLRKNGFCATKVFRGADFDAMIRSVKQSGLWSDVRTVKVQASRDRSREVYVVMRKRK